ncbi:stage III sporulation protein AG [Dethiobacter alkaliphilus]|uniref:Stage III sporulation protein AG n=1 Tax=Dethiobacter alkaliphilus AHT 1 TaxID=555088 RepID=C0GE37_DETAL|nr:stage III sporulation protein AG [Dethiobacter alkaliphilus]EEG78331.1 stage III sporulation protein AG [Dethiobacter alkaliphilus AHT 1]MCW3490275.1 stage III sporulation protein AG [Dethiobacter alkaliphilus]
MGENFWQRFAKLGKGEGPGKGQRSTWFILMLAVIGIVFMFISANPEQDRSPRPAQESNAEVVALPRSQGDYRQQLEKDLESRLERMQGVDEVSVMVTLESGPVSEYAQNKETTERTTTEEDGAGGQRDVSETTTRNQAVMARDGSGDEAVVTRKLEPQIRGVMVVARGAENPMVKEQITLAVEAALNISAHRIHVVPMK